MKQRIYTVTPKGGETRLIKAGSRAQALAHVAHRTFDVEAATAITVGQLMAKGVKLESVDAMADRLRELALAEAEKRRELQPRHPAPDPITVTD